MMFSPVERSGTEIDRPYCMMLYSHNVVLAGFMRRCINQDFKWALFLSVSFSYTLPSLVELVARFSFVFTPAHSFLFNEPFSCLYAFSTGTVPFDVSTINPHMIHNPAHVTL